MGKKAVSKRSPKNEFQSVPVIKITAVTKICLMLNIFNIFYFFAESRKNAILQISQKPEETQTEMQPKE